MNWKDLMLVGMFALVIAGIGTFKTGCTPFARAENVMLTRTYSFAVIGDIEIVSVSPADKAVGVKRDEELDISFTHELPVTSVEMVVLVDGTEFAGTQVVTDIPNGKRVVWTPDGLYPIHASVSWTLVVNVENGQ